MTQPAPPFVAPADQAGIAVERAIAEFRAGRPLIVCNGDSRQIVLAVEGFDTVAAAAFTHLSGEEARLLLPAARLRRLGLADRQTPGSVALPGLDPDRVETLALHLDARLDAPVAPIRAGDEAALELARLSLTLPVLISAKAGADIGGLITVTAADILAYRAHEAKALRIVGRAPVPLENAKDSEFVVFRGGEGMRDQVAIIVGKPDFKAPVPVRLHSACLTGDLFGSLKCDCGDQLRGTIGFMAEHGGGVLLYLDQEGRGNGIANKMRAYALQAQGFDTYDADEVLGFDLDQRRFDFAATMLTMLGITRVELMTNNPVKLASLRDAGLDVVAERRVIGRPTKENVSYLTTKHEKAGHVLDPHALKARLSAGD